MVRPSAAGCAQPRHPGAAISSEIRKMRFLVTRLEVLLSVAALATVEGIFWPPGSFFTKKSLVLDASDPLAAAAHAGVLLLVVLATLARPREMLRGARCAGPVLVVVALAFLSAFWSDAPELVLRRSMTLATATLFAVYLASRFDMARLVAILVGLNAVAAAASFAVIAIAPQFAFDTQENYATAWRGAYVGKNTLGAMCAIGVILAVYAWRQGYVSRLICLALIPANLVLLEKSQAGTPRLMLLAALAAAILAATFRKRSGPTFAAGFLLLVLGVIGIGLLAVEWQAVLALLDRNPTLTGRVKIWQVALGYFQHRPWLGHGYGAFWRTGSVEAQTIWQRFLWTVPHAHNAWIEIGLNLGILGIAGISWLWAAAFYRGIRVLAWPPSRHVVFCLTLLAAILIENLTEYEFLRPDSPIWILYVIAFVYLGQELLARRNERTAPAQPAQRVMATRRFGTALGAPTA
jgi:exopolysaccharide production protein ExoQ